MIRNMHIQIVSLRIILILIVNILLANFCTEAVCALDEGFYSTISLSIRSIGAENITYKTSQIVGEYSYNVIRNNSMDSLTNDGYKRRVYNLYERVALPPLSVVDIGYYWYNNTPNTVDVNTIRIPLSRQNQQMGDLTKLLYDSGFEVGVTCTENICRGGKYIDLEGVGLITSDMNQEAKNGIYLEQLTIKPPVLITRYEIKYYSEGMSQLKLYVQNTTEEYLKDVRINYRDASGMTVDLDSYEEKEVVVYKYCDLYENEVNCGQMKIIDNNTRTYCMAYGSHWDSYNNPDSIILFNKIGEQWMVGAQIQPTVESFCIQRIPYKYTTEDTVAYIEPEDPPSLSQEEYWKELLNIDILPITSYQFKKFNRYLSLLKPLGIDNLKVL